MASTNAFEPLRVERRLPITVVFYAHVHPGYGGQSPGRRRRLCYTDGGAISPSPMRERLLDEAIRLAEAMHDKNPYGEVPFDGGKTVLVQEGTRFQAVTALYGAIGMPLFILAKGGVRYYASGAVDAAQKQDAVCRWAASSVLADILAHKHIGGPDMRMGEEEMAWVDAAAVEIGAARQVRQLPAVTGLAAEVGGFPHEVWELTGRTVAASLKEALRHAGMARYGLDSTAPIRVLIQGFGDVGGSGGPATNRGITRLCLPDCGRGGRVRRPLSSVWADVPMLLGLRAARRPMVEYSGIVDALWVATPSEVDRARPGFRGTDGRVARPGGGRLHPGGGPERYRHRRSAAAAGTAGG